MVDITELKVRDKIILDSREITGPLVDSWSTFRNKDILSLVSLTLYANTGAIPDASTYPNQYAFVAAVWASSELKLYKSVYGASSYSWTDAGLAISEFYQRLFIVGIDNSTYYRFDGGSGLVPFIASDEHVDLIITNSSDATVPLTVDAVEQSVKLQSWQVASVEKAYLDNSGIGHFDGGVAVGSGVDTTWSIEGESDFKISQEAVPIMTIYENETTGSYPVKVNINAKTTVSELEFGGW